MAAPRDRAQTDLRRENGPQPGRVHIGIIESSNKTTIEEIQQNIDSRNSCKLTRGKNTPLVVYIPLSSGYKTHVQFVDRGAGKCSKFLLINGEKEL